MYSLDGKKDLPVPCCFFGFKASSYKTKWCTARAKQLVLIQYVYELEETNIMYTPSFPARFGVSLIF